MPASMVQYLKQNYQEPEPKWLQLAEKASDPEARREIINGFLRSRIVYYPGAGRDGHPVKLFNQAHSAHAYICVDWEITRERLQYNLTPNPNHPHCGFRGYRTLPPMELLPQELGPWPPRYHVVPREMPPEYRHIPRDNPYALLYFFERLPEYGDDHGARRFAILALLADGFAAYDALFCQEESLAKPFCVVLEDYYWFFIPLVYEQFGRNGLLERIASTTGVFPELLLASEVAKPWQGYKLPQLEGQTLEPERGGMHGRLRNLYERAM